MMKLGIAGIGVIGESYLKLFKEGRIKEGEVAAVASRNTQRVAKILEKLNLQEVRVYGSLKEMLEKESLSGVIITTPHKLHVSMMKEALQMGVSVLTDKPLSSTRKEAEEMAVFAKDYPDLVKGVLFNKRANPIHKEIKKIIESGELGILRRALYEVTDYYRSHRYYEESGWRGTYEEEGGGVLMNQAVHQMDLLTWFTDLPKEVMAFLNEGRHRPMTTENDAYLHLFYEDGAVGHFITSTHESPGVHRLELSFDQGQILMENEKTLKITKLREPEEDFSRKTETLFDHVPGTLEVKEFEPLEDKEEHVRTIENFIRAIEGKEKIQCSLEEALKSITLVNAAYLSHFTGMKSAMDFSLEEYDRELHRKIQEERALKEEKQTGKRTNLRSV